MQHQKDGFDGKGGNMGVGNREKTTEGNGRILVFQAAERVKLQDPYRVI